MKITFLLSLLFFSFQSFAVNNGDVVPSFKLKNADGKEFDLNALKGHYVVLEWLNHGCPFVKKHYNSENMQNLQKEFTAKGVKWVSIISSAPGKQGHVSEKEALKEKVDKGSNADYILLDPTGKVGKMYGAQTTPHIYILDKTQKLAYQGAVDDTPSTDPDDIKGSKNYVRLALNELMNNKKIKFAKTKPYGCSVKY